MLKTAKMLKVVAFIVSSGLILAFYSGMLVKLISNTVDDVSEKLTKALLWMIVFGIGEVLGAILIGKLIEKTNNKSSVFWVTILVMITCVTTAFQHSRQTYDFVWFGVTFLWGLCDSTINTTINSICGIEFGSKIEPFAITKFVQAVVACVFLIAESNIKDSEHLDIQRWYMISIGVYTAFACALIMTIRWR